MAGTNIPSCGPVAREREGRSIGWPSVLRTQTGALLAVFSGDRLGHISPEGKVRLVRSGDCGATWSEPRTIADTPIDDRDAGICQLPDGEILVSWFSSIAYLAHRYFRTIYGRGENRPMAELAALVDTWCVRSRDDGRTWSAPERLPLRGSAPHGPLVLADGALLSVGRVPPQRELALQDWDKVRMSLCCERSDDGGRSWQLLCPEIPVAPEDADGANLFHEPSVAELPGGRLVALSRYHGPDGCFRCARSADGGRTWSRLERTSLAAGKTAPHLLALRDGRLLCTYGLRRGEDAIGVFAAFSADAGATWTDTESGCLWRAEPGMWSGDIGYPATVALDGGTLLTVFYAPEHLGRTPCLMAAKWKP